MPDVSMLGTLFIIVVLIIFILAVIVANIKIVPQAHAFVVERLGAFHASWGTGLHVKIPFLDRIAKKVSLKEQVIDFPPQPVITKDNVTMQIDTVVYFQITDPIKAVYEISNLPDAIEKLTQTTLRNVIGEMDLDETLTSRDTINSKLRAVLDDATNKWGVKVNRVELQDINPPRDIRDAMEKQMRAERDKRAKILESEGTKASHVLESEGRKISEINHAEGEKQAHILRAEGEAQAQVLKARAEAEAIRQVTEAVAATQTDPAAYLLALRYIDSLKEMDSGKESKTVFMPYEATGVLGSLGSIREMFKEGLPKG